MHVATTLAHPRSGTISHPPATRDTGHVHADLTAGPAGVQHARAHTRRTLAAWHLPKETISDAELIISEMATNVVAHSCAASYTLTLSRLPHTLSLAVTHHDAGPTTPARRRADPDDEHGRGLTIIAALATAWGTSHGAGRTRTWAQLTPPHTLR